MPLRITLYLARTNDNQDATYIGLEPRPQVNTVEYSGLATSSGTGEYLDMTGNVRLNQVSSVQSFVSGVLIVFFSEFKIRIIKKRQKPHLSALF